ncbi:MAG: protein kinase domain-containing protein, partial [Byssovorax sp.]
MTIDIVRGELERLFSLDEMMALSKDLLGFAPSEIGGGASKASFARALTDRCLEADAIEALLDAVLASRTEVDPRIRELGQKGLTLPEEIKVGETFGPFTITKKLGEGPRGFVYTATKDGVDRTLKVLGREATRDARAARRFITRVRLAAAVRHENLPTDLEVGIEGGRVWVAYAPIDGQPLAVRIGRTGPLHINEARSLLRGILEALGALHGKHLVHGAIKLENVIVARGEGGASRPV